MNEDVKQFLEYANPIYYQHRIDNIAGSADDLKQLLRKLIEQKQQITAHIMRIQK